MFQLQYLIVEGYGCEPRRYSYVEQFAEGVINTMQVRPRQRQGYEIDSLIPDATPGVSIQVLFLESHLTIDTYTEHGLATLNVASCKPFNADLLIREFKRFFQAGEIKIVLKTEQ